MGNNCCIHGKDTDPNNPPIENDRDKTQVLNQEEQRDIQNNEQIFSNNEDVFLGENQKKVDLNDFVMDKVLGRGSFGKVVLVRHKQTNQAYAVKVLIKDMVKKRNQQIHTQSERNILEQLNDNPFVVKMHYAFQTQTRLYMVLDFCQGGELFYHLRTSQRFSENRARFYIAQIILALESLHNLGVIYRDLKPENVLLDHHGYVKITDFGLSKEGVNEDNKTHTICGTPEYLAPEIIMNQGHDQAVDYWSLGAILYEMVSGAPPFYSRDRQAMFRNILYKPIEMKSYFSTDLCSLLTELLQVKPEKRLKDANQIKQHEFFNGVDWEKMKQKKYNAPFKPKVASQYDLRYFDKMFTNEQVRETPITNVMNQSTDVYNNFTYISKNI